MDGQGAGTPTPAQNLGARDTVIPILIYHTVPRESGRTAGKLAVGYPRFATHLDAIGDSGRVALTVSELAAGLRGERTLPERPVGITFDDGYADTSDAVELLSGNGLRASVFITTGQVGGASMLDEAQVRCLAQAPDLVELGAHSVTHPHLDELRPIAVEWEVSASKERLEQIIGRAVQSFAYPYGSYDARVRAAVIAAGFSSAVAVKNALSHARDDPWAIARWTVRATTTASQITEVLEGRGVPRAWREERLRTRSYRTVRRLRRTLTGGASK
jgi:hypothetical protein